MPRREKVVEDRPLRVLGVRLAQVAVARLGAACLGKGLGLGFGLGLGLGLGLA